MDNVRVQLRDKQGKPVAIVEADICSWEIIQFEGKFYSYSPQSNTWEETNVLNIVKAVSRAP